MYDKIIKTVGLNKNNIDKNNIDNNNKIENSVNKMNTIKLIVLGMIVGIMLYPLIFRLVNYVGVRFFNYYIGFIGIGL